MITKHKMSVENLNKKLELGKSIYSKSDLTVFQGSSTPMINNIMAISSIDDLLKRDEQREEDGFPKKIKIGKIVKPSSSGKKKIVIVPTTSEEKFVHDNRPFSLKGEGQPSGGTGEGKEGDILGEVPLCPKDGEGENGPGGQGEGDDHDLGVDAYEIGKILTERFKLPNIKDKGKKKFLKKYTYDLTDKNKGSGQFLDKKATLKEIIKTNMGLGRIPDINNIDPSKLLVAPRDYVYRILSREREYESQAIVFFLRDYSGSMWGKPTELILSQHIFIYSWLMYQYEERVMSRFIVHDTEAKEVPDFDTYYKLNVSGGTEVNSAFKLLNEIIENEVLARDYNIYVFYGTDGEDWENDGTKAVEEITKTISYANRTGITIAEGPWTSRNNSVVEKYMRESGLLEKYRNLIRLYSFSQEDATEEILIGGIKELVSEK